MEGLKVENMISSISKSDQYSLIAIFSILGGSLLMSSLDLLSMYLSIELQSFALYILATLNKDKLSATSAGLKYFLLGSLSSCFILLGSAIIYSYTGLTQFEAINTLLSVPYINNISTLTSTANEVNLSAIESIEAAGSAYLPLQTTEGNVLIEMLDINKAFTIGLIIILIGFLFKISAAPFYQ
jgi:NADH:ubiquinone oxidoreductase subunit 2 (subunit N)